MSGVALNDKINSAVHSETLEQLRREVSEPLKATFFGKDEIVDLLVVALVARENLFLLGPPGTAKSALVRMLSERLGGRVFDYLLTKFTEPNELFGPFDIRRLRDGELVTNTAGMLPEADFVFLDELLNANSSILNSLLMALNERIFRRGRETKALPAVIFVGASNRLPEDEALQALFDRFLLRVRCDNVDDMELQSVLRAGWEFQNYVGSEASADMLQRLRSLQTLVNHVDLRPIRSIYSETILKLRRVGMAISDRRAVKLQRTIAASALLCGRMIANTTDLWVLRHIWDLEEQREVLSATVTALIEQSSESEKSVSHPQTRAGTVPTPEDIMKSLQMILSTINNSGEAVESKVAAREQLSILSTRIQWIADVTQRQFLEEQCNEAWSAIRALDEA